MTITKGTGFVPFVLAVLLTISQAAPHAGRDWYGRKQKDYNTENETFDDKIELEKDLDFYSENGPGAPTLEDAQAAAGGFNIWKEIREWVFAIVLALVVVGLIKGFCSTLLWLTDARCRRR